MSNVMKREKIVLNKALFTVMILFIYLIGRKIPLYGIDIDNYKEIKFNAEDMIMQTITGDAYKYSIFALGISPYMFSSIVAQMVTYYKKSVNQVRVSMIKVNRATAIMTLVLAIIQAVLQVNNLEFHTTGSLLLITKFIVILEMIVGVMLIMWFSERNKKYGIGGQTAIILVNIIDGMLGTIMGRSIDLLMIPLIIAFIMIPVVIIMENAEKRIPIQRVSIHNIYADKNYLAIKLNPIGVMPIMFAATFFMIPQLILTVLLYFFKNQEDLLWIQNNLKLSEPLGIAAYIGILFFLTILFSNIIINPNDLADQFLKSGDSIVNVHAGEETTRYLKKSVFRIGLFSSIIMGTCVGVPLILQITGDVNSALVMFPSTVMMLTGLWCNIFTEVKAIKSFEQYKLFI